jgi:hypothetical protein
MTMLELRVEFSESRWHVKSLSDSILYGSFDERADAFACARDVAERSRPSYVGVEDESGALIYDMRLA